MKILLTIFNLIGFGLVLYIAYVADQCAGIAAYTVRFFLFSLITAAIFGLLFIPVAGKRSIGLAAVFLGLLTSIFYVNPPSERILRGILIEVPNGSVVDDVKRLVSEKYDNTKHVFPRITEADDRLHVSLLSQSNGNCTAIVFELADDKVVRGFYSPD